MGNLSNLNMQNVQAAQSFEVLPVGDYVAIVTASEIKQTRAGTGEYVSVEFQLTDAPYKGRKLWSNFNISNPNPKAVEIGLGQLKALGDACGVVINDTNDILNKVCIVSVKIANDQNGNPKNEASDYKSAQQAAATPQQAPAPQYQPQAQAPQQQAPQQYQQPQNPQPAPAPASATPEQPAFMRR